MIKLTLEIQGETLQEVLNQLHNSELKVSCSEDNSGDCQKSPKKRKLKKEEKEPEARVIEEVIEDESSKEILQAEKVESQKSDITMESLLDLAKSKVSEFSREIVKEVISKYGSRISEIDPSDYENLKKDLEGLS